MTRPVWEEVSTVPASRLSLPPLDDDVEAEVAVVVLGGSGLTAIGEGAAADRPLRARLRGSPGGHPQAASR
jgi:hypothetical protein